MITRFNATATDTNVKSINLDSLNVNTNYKLAEYPENSNLVNEYRKISKEKICNAYTLYIQKNFKPTVEKNPGSFLLKILLLQT